MSTPTEQPRPDHARRRALHAYTCLMRAASTVTDRVHRHLTADDLTVSQFGVLEALLHLGPLQQAQLCEKLLTSRPNMTAVVDQLEARRLVSRRVDPNDRRARIVALTRTGRSLITRVFARHADIVTADFDALSASQLDQLAKLCRTLGRRSDST